MAKKNIERIFLVKSENRKIVINIEENYLIIYELSELDPTVVIKARHFKLIEVG